MSVTSKQKKRNKVGIISYLMSGRLLTSRLITENTWLLALIVLYALYMSATDTNTSRSF